MPGCRLYTLLGCLTFCVSLSLSLSLSLLCLCLSALWLLAPCSHTCTPTHSLAESPGVVAKAKELEETHADLLTKISKVPVDTLLYIAITRATWGIIVVEPDARRFVEHYVVGKEGRSRSRAGALPASTSHAAEGDESAALADRRQEPVHRREVCWAVSECVRHDLLDVPQGPVYR